MLEKIKKWILGLSESHETSSAKRLRQSGAHVRPVNPPRDRRAGRDRRKQVDNDDQADKTPPVRRRYQREDTGTHETLTIIDDSIVDSDEETGIDPYNTGNFDRSRNWDKRFRK